MCSFQICSMCPKRKCSLTPLAPHSNAFDYRRVRMTRGGEPKSRPVFFLLGSCPRWRMLESHWYDRCRMRWSNGFSGENKPADLTKLLVNLLLFNLELSVVTKNFIYTLIGNLVWHLTAYLNSIILNYTTTAILHFSWILPIHFVKNFSNGYELFKKYPF